MAAYRGDHEPPDCPRWKAGVILVAYLCVLLGALFFQSHF